MRNNPLREIDDETLIDMYDHAHETSDMHCDAIAAELHWRGIEVPPCNKAHASVDSITGLTRQPQAS
jgi:hypothetical protein